MLGVLVIWRGSETASSGPSPFARSILGQSATSELPVPWTNESNTELRDAIRCQDPNRGSESGDTLERHISSPLLVRASASDTIPRHVLSRVPRRRRLCNWKVRKYARRRVNSQTISIVSEAYLS